VPEFTGIANELAFHGEFALPTVSNSANKKGEEVKNLKAKPVPTKGAIALSNSVSLL
jgi:hypothetical protein